MTSTPDPPPTLLAQEQALADLDQSIADREQTLADRDQAAVDHAEDQLERDRTNADPADFAKAVHLGQRQGDVDRHQARTDARQDQIDLSQAGGNERQELLDTQRRIGRPEPAAEPPTTQTLHQERGVRRQAAIGRAAAARERAHEALRRAEAAEQRALIAGEDDG
jgi:hypothetical protein